MTDLRQKIAAEVLIAIDDGYNLTKLTKVFSAHDVSQIQDRVTEKLVALLEDEILAARIDEVEAAVTMKGKSLVGGETIIDTSSYEGGQPDSIPAAILELRLTALRNKRMEGTL